MRNIGKVHFPQKFESFLSEMHHLVEVYAEEHNLLRLQNTVLQNEIKNYKHHLEKHQKKHPHKRTVGECF